MPITINGDSGLSGVNGSAGTPALQGTDSNTGIVFGTDTVQVSTGGSTRATVDSSGRLLVGTSSDLSGNDADVKLQVSSSGGATIQLARDDSSTVSDNLLGAIVGSTTDGGASQRVCQINFRADGDQASNDHPGRIEFLTTADGASSPTERMRISQNGGINTFSASDHYFAVRNSGTSSSLNAFIVFQGATATTNGTPVMVVRQDGDLENANNNYGSLSDVKLKENIVDAGSQWNDLKTLQVRKYNFKAETGYSTHTQIGLIAQEIELVSPGLVSESPDKDGEGNDLGTTTKSVSYSVLYMKAIKALQEAMTRIETLETKVAALEAG